MMKATVVRLWLALMLLATSMPDAARSFASTGGIATSSYSGIANTTDDPLYQAYRYGTAANPMTYTIPFSVPGNYTVTMKFAEPTYTTGGRVFTVTMESAVAPGLDSFDIYVAAGNAKNKAVDRSVAVTVTDGFLNINFQRGASDPIVSAIEVTWAGSSPATPTVVYTYRGDGLRSTKTITTTPTITYTWDLNSGLPTVLQDGMYSYVYGLGGLISQTDGSGNQTYFLGNGLGSTEKLTDGSGNIVASYKYDIFGAVRSSSGSGSTEYRFTGQQGDPTLGYTYLRARYYDPQTGRFLSKDPVRGTLTNPASQYYYGYAQNNPINLTDPSGECPQCFIRAFEVAQRVGPVIQQWAQRVGPRIALLGQGVVQQAQRFAEWCVSRNPSSGVQITFQTQHAERHLIGTRLSSAEVGWI